MCLVRLVVREDLFLHFNGSFLKFVSCIRANMAATFLTSGIFITFIKLCLL